MYCSGLLQLGLKIAASNAEVTGLFSQIFITSSALHMNQFFMFLGLIWLMVCEMEMEE